ncbi:MAG TPA: UDP-N-acetylmuramate--L-alanine ligase [Alphaproteobacteria bacterium]|nr:UDP-N-acetylmuramate--L-alanine ligase [Alphaproteobacteria bacterium]HNS45237.1 UDP-N-acetylmuramate--L-alanine ligase [Alphaproteobacteria bacterium]
MRHIPPEIGVLHFIGIGGIGMSGIAEALATLGYEVQGSDLNENYNTERLRGKNIRVLVGHSAANLKTTDGKFPGAVVVSSAIKEDNPELRTAREMKIPVVPRAEMLAELMRLKWAVTIAGTHGKTTTTSLVGAMLETGDLDPTVINGGIINSYGTNARLGQGDWMVVEADESDGSFTKLPATIAIVTNIDPEHMEHYGSFDAVREAYFRYIEQIPFYGCAVLCLDHPVVQGLIPDVKNRTIITYGFNKQADIHAVNVRSNSLGSTFDVEIAGHLREGGQQIAIKDIFLPMMGQHNVQNACAAIAVACKLGLDERVIKAALGNFGGVKRRFTRTGVSNGILVVDDYGHHPVEIAAVLKAGRQAVSENSGKIIAICQPHRYTRLSSLFDEFCTCFDEADTVIVADVYAAGETPIEGATKTHLVEGIKAHGHRDVRSLDHPEDLPTLIARIAQAGDVVICLGAGNITQWAHALPKHLDEELAKSSMTVKEAANA